MTATTTKAGPFSQADGPQIIDMKSEGWKKHHEISVLFEDSGGSPFTPVQGTLQFEAEAIGSDVFQPFLENLNLANSERSFLPFQSNVKRFRVTPVNLEAAARYRVLIINMEQN